MLKQNVTFVIPAKAGIYTDKFYFYRFRIKCGMTRENQKYKQRQQKLAIFFPPPSEESFGHLRGLLTANF